MNHNRPVEPAVSNTDAYRAFKAKRFFPSLNGLRAVCAIAVIKEHTLFHLPLPRLFEMGFLGVDMFFVISGFLIVTLLLRERESTGRIDLGAFYLRRTLRIFPIYYLAIALLFSAAVLTYGHSTKTWDLYKWSFLVFVVYAQDLIVVPMGLLFHTWSLAMEEQFYLVWPSVEKFLGKWLWVVLVAGLILCQASNFGLLNSAIDSLYGFDTAHDRPLFLATFTSILLGVAGAHAMNDDSVGPWLIKLLRGYWSPALIFALALGVCQFDAPLQGWMRASIYLYHTFVIACAVKIAEVFHLTLPPAILFLITLVVAIGVAAASFRYFETPVMSLRRHKPVGGIPASAD